MTQWLALPQKLVILSDAPSSAAADEGEESKDLRLPFFTLPQKPGAPHLDSEMWESTNLNQRVLPFHDL
jgi:hypothetical protein